MSRSSYVQALGAALDRVWAELAASYFRFFTSALGHWHLCVQRRIITLYNSPILQRRVCAAACWPPQPRLRLFEWKRRRVHELVSARYPALGQPVRTPRIALRRHGPEHVRIHPRISPSHFLGCDNSCSYDTGTNYIEGVSQAGSGLQSVIPLYNALQFLNGSASAYK
jgi:hypothetical protein